MKIAVLNGSPKGEVSVTMQYIKYLQKHFRDHEFTIVNIAHKIKKIKTDQDYFQQIMDEVAESQGIIWACPVYVLNVPGQYKQFIELVFQQKKEQAFQGKYTAVLTTSIHFYDNFAADYLHGVCDDLTLHYVGEFLAEMTDLTLPARRRQLLDFFDYFLQAMQAQRATPVHYQTISKQNFDYEPKSVEAVAKLPGKRIVVLSDETNGDSNLTRMIDVFGRSAQYQVNVINIREIGMKGGCLGCIHCGCDNDCVYSDPFKQVYEKHIMTADAVVYAGTITDRYLSATWKLFFDRTFVYGHTPTLSGKHVGFLISGPLNQVPNLRETLKVYAQLVSETYAVEIITDECESSGQLTSIIQGFSNKLSWAIEHHINAPLNFYGHATHLIFRDFIYLAHGIFVADHRYYKIHNFYDFPQKNIKKRLFNIFLRILTMIPPAKKQFQRTMKKNMIRGLQKIVEES